VTVESPIRSDGKRCNALLAWGDGVEPYLANASAEERCAVEKEAPETFRVDAFLESRQVKIQSSTSSSITLVIREDNAERRLCTTEVHGDESLRRRNSAT
jgi:hypothetical protein